MLFEYPPGATPLNPEEIEGLRMRHITTRSELDRWEQENIADAEHWVQRSRSVNFLSEDFVVKLHSKMFSKVWEWAGQFRRSEKNIGIQWSHIPVQLRILIDDVRYWIAHKTFSLDEIAVRFHHRLVQIHCFPNGNGRHARLMTDIILSRMLGVEPFTWGNGDLMNQNDVRDRYILALRAADIGDYKLLLDFVRS